MGSKLTLLSELFQIPSTTPTAMPTQESPAKKKKKKILSLEEVLRRNSDRQPAPRADTL